MKTIIFEELESTNDYLKANHNKFDNFSVVRAIKQTKGRGQFDRKWESDDDLTFSILFHNDALYNLIIPLALNKVLSSFNLNSKIKWPNDLYVDDLKISGILIEKIFEEKKSVIIVGIGLNFSYKETFNYLAKYDILDKEKVLDLIVYEIKNYLRLENELLKNEFLAKCDIIGKVISNNNTNFEVIDLNLDGNLVLEELR